MLGVRVLRLFLSVDMVGSTEFKARFSGQESDGWLPIFRTFFTQFPLMMAGQIGFAFLDDPATPAIDVWKVMGDEVLFTADPASADEMTAILLAVLRTMRLYEARHFGDLPLRLKGTAWLAELDGPNIRVEIPELSSGAGAHFDFIGPDIDLGFRVTKFARPGVMAVSLDVLEAILASEAGGAAGLYLLGREALKGVMFGQPYPMVWLHDADAPLPFLPWEIDRDPLMAQAARSGPTARADLQRAVDDMRGYLRKVHGRDRPAPVFGPKTRERAQ